MAHAVTVAVPNAASFSRRYRATVIHLARGSLLFLGVEGPLLPFGADPYSGSRPEADAPHLDGCVQMQGPAWPRVNSVIVLRREGRFNHDRDVGCR
jgi:hypothetical protein